MNIGTPTQIYRQSARAAASAATGERILDAFASHLRVRWYDEIRLEDVAHDAEVTVQTVLRRFGSKEQLLEAMHQRMGLQIRRRRSVTPGDIHGVVEALAEDYEEIGTLILRMLAQEDRHLSFREATNQGRAGHRQWMGDAFAPWLDKMAPEARRRATDALVVAGDVYVWKLLRQDLARPLAEYRSLVEQMCWTAIGASMGELFEKVRSRTTS